MGSTKEVSPTPSGNGNGSPTPASGKSGSGSGGTGAGARTSAKDLGLDEIQPRDLDKVYGNGSQIENTIP